MFCVVIVYSSLLSFQTPHSLPRVCSTLLIVCPSLIVCTCSSSPSVFSLCVAVSRCQFVFVSPVFQAFQRFPMFSAVLALTTLACVLDSVIAFSLPVPLPLQTTTCVTTLDWINDDPGCPSLIGFVCLYLYCFTVERTHSVKVDILHLCLRVEHLDPTFPRTLHSEDLSRTLNTSTLVKKAHQRLFFLRRLKKDGENCPTHHRFLTPHH